ncbi:MAG: hypothetical protein EOO11_03415 [Chitinophagaceae bacterium]|nr:MAG: hypothetical protein EOO11_03415 [Chitinophagaceae bacterium]
MNFRSLLPALGFGLLLSACSKDKDAGSALPSSKASFAFTLHAGNPSVALGRVQGGTLTWTAGTASANAIKFEAERGSTEVEYGSSVQQTIDLFAANTSLGSITLDSGTYREVEFKAFLAPNGAAPALELRGSYTSNGTTTPVTFRAEEAVLLKAEKHNVTLSGATSYEATAPINLQAVAQGISASALDNATRTGGSILITSSSNGTLYQALLRNLRSLSDEAEFHHR